MILWNLPTVVNPANTVCVQLEIPDDPAYIAAFWGQIVALTNWFNWERDPAHTAVLAATRMRLMYLAAQLNNCICPPPTSGGGGGGGDFLIRQNPDNPCEIQVSADGTTWCTFIDLSKCITNPQPGGGTTPPQPGECKRYTIQFNANGVGLIPVPVNTGDKITLLSADGAATDGGGGWFCPSGLTFFAGACVGVPTFIGSDPVPAAPHMSVILGLAPAFYQLTAGMVFLVPSGVAGIQPTLQVNDSSLGDDAGSLTCVVEVCNTQSAPTTWCQNINFALSPSIFGPKQIGPVPDCGGSYAGDGAVYASGLGWNTKLVTHVACDGGSNGFCEVIADLGPGALLTNVEITGSVGGSGTTSSEVAVILGSEPTFTASPEFVIDNTGVSGAFDFSSAVTTPKRYIWLFVDNVVGGANNAVCQIFTVKLQGTGTNPFGTSNC